MGSTETEGRLKRVSNETQTNINHIIMKFYRLKNAVAAGWMKSFGAACLLAAATLPGFAQSDASELCLKVELSNGSTEQFLLSEQPKLTFEGNSCVISCKDVDASYDMAQIKRAYFADRTVGVDVTPGEIVSIDLTDPAWAVVRGLEPGAPVALYAVSGITLQAVNADSDGVARISLESLASQSVYVVSINSNNNFKLYKK